MLKLLKNKNRFLDSKPMIYLDNHSTTPVDDRVFKKMMPYFSEKYNNPHSQITKHNASIL